MKSTSSIPTRRDVTNLPDERWQDHAPSTIRFRTLFSAPDTPTDSIVCGIAMMAAGDTFALHAHDHAEVYFGLEGDPCKVNVSFEFNVWLREIIEHLADGGADQVPGVSDG